MEFVRKRLQLDISSAIHDKLHADLPKDYAPLISSAKENFRKMLRMSRQEVSPDRGELFIFSDEALLYYLISRDKKYLEAGGFFSKEAPLNVFDGYVGKIKEIVSAFTDKLIEVEEAPTFNPIFEHIREEANEVEFNPEEIEVARALADERLRVLIDNFKEKFTITEEFASKELVESLTRLNVVKKEFVILCRKTGKQISRLSTQESVKSDHLSGFKCFSCGRPLSEEDVQELISLTPLGRVFLQPNNWLSLNLADKLRQFGIKDKMILVKPVKRHKLIDCFINYNGYLLFGGIKDAPLDLKDIYYLITQASYYQVDYAFILNPYPLSEPARYFLTRHAEFPIEVIDSLDNVGRTLSYFLEKIRQSLIEKVLKEFDSFTKVDADQVLVNFFKEAVETEEPPEAVPEIKECAELKEKEKIKEEPIKDLLEELSISLSEKTGTEPASSAGVEFEDEFKPYPAISGLLEEIKTGGIAGRYNILRDLSSEIARLPFYSISLIDSKEALYVIDCLSPHWEKDKLCVYSSVLFKNFKKIQHEKQFECACFIFEGEKGKFQFDDAGSGFFVLTVKEPSAEARELPPLGEDEAEEVLDSFCNTEGGRGAFLAGEAGNIIEDKSLKEVFNKASAASLIAELMLGEKDNISSLVSKLNYFILFYKEYVLITREVSGSGYLIAFASSEDYLKNQDEICNILKI